MPKNEPSDMSKDFGFADPDIILSSARYLIGQGYGPVTAGKLGSLLDVSDGTGGKWIAAILKHYPNEWVADGEGITIKL